MEPDEDGLQTIIAEVPLAELANFTTFIRQTTQGRGWFTTEFARYEVLPLSLIHILCFVPRSVCREFLL